MMLLSTSFTEIISWVGYIIVALLCLMFMIVVHETGHYVVGKIFKFRILEFSIGFGPKLFQRVNKESGEKFSIRAIPLGGYCQFAGEEEEGKVEDGDFNTKPAWQRILVLFAGAFMNLVSAVIIITIFFMSWGDYIPTVRYTYPYTDSEYVQQFEVGDLIYSVDGHNTYALMNRTKVQNAIKDKDEVYVKVLRNGEFVEFTVKLADYAGYAKNAEGEEIEMSGYGLGITIGYTKVQLSFFDAIGRAFTFLGEVIALMFTSIGKLFTGAAKIKNTMGGTATAIESLAILSQSGFAAVMYGVCVLSASMGLMNLMPIPALDGAKIVQCFIEWITKKELNRKIIAIVDLVSLGILFAFAITCDILHFFG